MSGSNGYVMMQNGQSERFDQITFIGTLIAIGALRGVEILFEGYTNGYGFQRVFIRLLVLAVALGVIGYPAYLLFRAFRGRANKR